MRKHRSGACIWESRNRSEISKEGNWGWGSFTGNRQGEEEELCRFSLRLSWWLRSIVLRKVSQTWIRAANVPSEIKAKGGGALAHFQSSSKIIPTPKYNNTLGDLQSLRNRNAFISKV